MKYKITNETLYVDGKTLHRIECIEPFLDIKSGDAEVCGDADYIVFKNN